MFWLFKLLLWLRGLLERALLRVLACGPIPQHIAFVMDGNRRYARKRQIQVAQGHSEGFNTLRRSNKLLEVCLHMKIRCVSVYAFSIENFKRSPDEVDALMNLAKAGLLELCENGDLLDQYGVRLNVLGKTDILPVDVQDAVRKAESMTRYHENAILNMCMPYTSRDEIATAVQSTVHQAITGGVSINSITEYSIDKNLMTSQCASPPLDILIRTSGVKRLSDFMLWQCCEDTQIQFTSAYWPDFGMREFIPMILDYQLKVWSRRTKIPTIKLPTPPS